MVRRRIIVHGRVQGVFFRDSTRRRAEQLGVAGWIANSPDGTVEAVFEGPADDVNEMVRFCEQGPRGAEVSHVEVIPEEPEQLSRFTIR